MRYDTPASLSMPGSAAAAVQSLPMREQIKHGLKDMGKASFSSAKNFGTVGAIFSGTECCIEGLRAKNDLENGVAAGCITGGILARKVSEGECWGSVYADAGKGWTTGDDDRMCWICGVQCCN